MAYLTTQAIVLHTADYRENDRMLSLLTPAHGQLDALCRGCKKPQSPLMASAQNERPEMAKLLLSRGADPGRTDNDGRTALSYAAGNKNTAVLRLFLDLPGAKINQGDERGMSPLMYAIRANNAEAVKLLLDRGANVNTRSRDGFSAAEMGRNKPDLAHFFPAPKKSQTRYTAPRRTVSKSSSPAKSTPKKTSSRRRRK